MMHQLLFRSTLQPMQSLSTRARPVACPPCPPHLQPLHELVHAVPRGLHHQLALVDALHRPLPHKLQQVVLVVAQAIQRKGGVVLQGSQDR